MISENFKYFINLTEFVCFDSFKKCEWSDKHTEIILKTIILLTAHLAHHVCLIYCKKYHIYCLKQLVYKIVYGLWRLSSQHALLLIFIIPEIPEASDLYV